MASEQAERHSPGSLIFRDSPPGNYHSVDPTLAQRRPSSGDAGPATMGERQERQTKGLVQSERSNQKNGVERMCRISPYPLNPGRKRSQRSRAELNHCNSVFAWWNI